MLGYFNGIQFRELKQKVCLCVCKLNLGSILKFYDISLLSCGLLFWLNQCIYNILIT